MEITIGELHLIEEALIIAKYQTNDEQYEILKNKLINMEKTKKIKF